MSSRGGIGNLGSWLWCAHVELECVSGTVLALIVVGDIVDRKCELCVGEFKYTTCDPLRQPWVFIGADQIGRRPISAMFIVYLYTYRRPISTHQTFPHHFLFFFFF